MVRRSGMAQLKRNVELERGQSVGEYLKTAVMFRLERKYNRSIYVLLSVSEGTGKALAKRYGVDASLISKWRKRLGIVDIPNPGQFSKVVI